MKYSGINYLTRYIKKNKVKGILEVGSAIGYSAIKMALVSPDIKIITLEKDAIRYKEALTNIKLFGLERQIEIVNIDALDYNTKEVFDLIFIDAAKGKNKDFFIHFQNNLNNNGTIITDNINFHGLLAHKDKIKSKNLKGLVNKIEDYKEFLNNNLEFKTIYVNVGDGISISSRIL